MVDAFMTESRDIHINNNNNNTLTHIVTPLGDCSSSSVIFVKNMRDTIRLHISES